MYLRLLLLSIEIKSSDPGYSSFFLSEMQRNREIEADFLHQKQEIKHNE